MPIELPTLPYPADALEPHVSAKTLEFHHGKHHKGYIDKLNAAIAGTSYEEKPLEGIVAAAYEGPDLDVFNHAAQAWNHAFLWDSMTPEGRSAPQGPLAEAIDEAFGGVDGFRTDFKKAAMGQFGSGWTWLVANGAGLDIVSTGNAFTPLIDNVTPLLTLDVWEHAYYLDYQNRRDDYVNAFLNSLLNWEFAEQNFEARRAAA